MPDLTTDLDPTYLPPAARPGAALDLTRGWPVRDESDDDSRELVHSGDEIQRLLTAAIGLFDSLLVGIVGTGNLGTVVRALVSLALREAIRARTVARIDDEPGLPIATTPSPPSRADLSDDVRGAIEPYATGPVGPEIVDRATMGVEFVAGIEADHPGSLDTFTNV